MGIHATEDLTALCGQNVEPMRSNHYDFDDFVVVELLWANTSPTRRGETGELGTLYYGTRREHLDWNTARLDCLNTLNKGKNCKLLGRVYN